MSTAEVIRKTRISNTDLQKANVSASEVKQSPVTVTGGSATAPLTELELLKQKLAIAEAALAKATAPKQKAFSSVSYLFTLLPFYINKDGLLPALDKPTAEILQKKVLDKQKELGIDKQYKLISTYTDYRFFSMTLQAIHSSYFLNVRTKPIQTIIEEAETIAESITE